MQLTASTSIEQTPKTVSELDLMAELLPLDGARVLELGCGRADKTRAIVRRFNLAEMIAAEVDPQALAYNLASEPVAGLRFTGDGAQQITEPDASVDIVLMFKSLHHVPKQQLPNALQEIARVLKPGGLAYISEPVFAGNLNEVIRLFHDEQQVRKDAFAAVVQGVEGGLLSLQEQRFFTAKVKFESFAQFANGIIHATHSEHNLSPAQLRDVETKFLSYASSEGYIFATPNRVDLLRRP